MVFEHGGHWEIIKFRGGHEGNALIRDTRVVRLCWLGRLVQKGPDVLEFIFNEVYKLHVNLYKMYPL